MEKTHTQPTSSSTLHFQTHLIAIVEENECRVAPDPIVLAEFGGHGAVHLQINVSFTF